MMRRVFAVWVAWCVFFVTALAPSIATAVTIPTVKVNNIHIPIFSPSGLPVVEVAAATVKKLNPWVAGISVGIQLAPLVIKALDGTEVGLGGGSGFEYNGSTTPPSWFNDIYYTCQCNHTARMTGATVAAVCTASAAEANTCGCMSGATPLSYSCLSSNETTGAFSVVSSPSGGSYNSTAFKSCPVGYTYNATIGCVKDDQTQVYQIPTFRPVVTPTGDMGWEHMPGSPAPNWTPGNPFEIDTPEGPAPVQITPRPDKGVTIRTDAPEAPVPGQSPQYTHHEVTINNYNVVTNVTTITNTSAATVPGVSLQLPDDYNREVTQVEIKDELKGAGAPPLPPQGPLVDAAKADSDAQIGQISQGIKDGYADKSSWFSWVWTPPIGTCAPFAGTVHGYAISWDLCPTIADINDVLGWLFAIFGAWSVYREMFGRA